MSLCCRRQRLPDCRRQRNRPEKFSGIQVVLARFIDGANQSVPFGVSVRQGNVYFAPFERRRITLVRKIHDHALPRFFKPGFQPRQDVKRPVPEGVRFVDTCGVERWRYTL